LEPSLTCEECQIFSKGSCTKFRVSPEQRGGVEMVLLHQMEKWRPVTFRILHGHDELAKLLLQKIRVSLSRETTESAFNQEGEAEGNAILCRAPRRRRVRAEAL